MKRKSAGIGVRTSEHCRGELYKALNRQGQKIRYLCLMKSTKLVLIFEVTRRPHFLRRLTLNRTLRFLITTWKFHLISRTCFLLPRATCLILYPRRFETGSKSSIFRVILRRKSFISPVTSFLKNSALFTAYPMGW